MKMPASNIIAFPGRRALCLDDAAPPLAARVEPGVVSSRSPTVVSIIDGNACDPADEEWLNAVTLVRISIQHARRKGVSLSSLPPALRVMLLRQCDRGQPACLMVRDWLTGNGPFLEIPGIQEETI